MRRSRHNGKRKTKLPRKARIDARVHTMNMGSFTWSGFIGFQPSELGGVVRSGQVHSAGLVWNNIG